MDCLRRKHQKKREHKKPRHVSAHVSPTHSQPSTLGPIANGSLPRVSSTGLWMETPSVYAVTPQQNYYYPHPHGYGMYGKEYTYPIPKAISESRIPQTGLPYAPHRPQFASQNNVFLLPVSSQRFYHSQHLAPLYEVPPPRGMEIYDYPFPVQNGGYRSKLLGARHTPEYYNNMSEFIMKPRVERSKSITEDRRPPKHQQKKEAPKQDNSFLQENGKIPVAINNRSHRSQWIDEERKVSQPSNGPTGGRKPHIEHMNVIQPNRGFTSEYEYVQIDKKAITSNDQPTLPSTSQLPQQHGSSSAASATIRSSENIPSSATDSMKILAKNKTDDQKKQPPFSSLVEDNNAKNIDQNDNEMHVRHYTYEGSIYAVPKRNANDSDYDNPIVNRIKDMVIDKTRSSNTASPSGSWRNPYENRLSKGVKTPMPSGDNSYEVSKITKVTTTVVESFEHAGISNGVASVQQTSNNIDVIDGLVLPDISDLDKDYSGISSPKPAVQNTVVTANQLKELTGLTSLLSERSKDNLSPRWSLDADSGVDDINKAGNHLATTAFEFLDSYLSDDEGTESLVGSPRLSPRGQKAGKAY